MPAKNTLKTDMPNSYYHVYSRGVAKQPIFLDNDDFDYFQYLFSRYLSFDQAISKSGVSYPHLRGGIELLAFCQMSNHFHMLFFQVEGGALTGLMRGMMTAYSKYFNLKYKRTGPVFESRYKAVQITSDPQLLHISRYIHMNPRYYKEYMYSSYQFYIGNKEAPEWLQPQRMLELFDSPSAYAEFCEDYVNRREILQQVKDDLAGY